MKVKYFEDTDTAYIELRDRDIAESKDEEPLEMFRDLKQKYGEWVLDVLEYDWADNLLKVLDEAVVRRALEQGQERLLRKAEGIRKRCRSMPHSGEASFLSLACASWQCTE